MGSFSVHVQLHFPRIVEDERIGHQLEYDDNDARIEQRTAIDEELNEHDGREEEGEYGGKEGDREV